MGRNLSLLERALLNDSLDWTAENWQLNLVTLHWADDLTRGELNDDAI